MTSSIVCPCCLERSFEPLIDFGIVPHSGSFLSEPKYSYQTIRLSFEFCSNCSLIRRKSFQDDICDYTNVTRTTAHRLPIYTTEIMEELRKKGIGNKEFIVEVGCNDGAFLSVLTQAGFTNHLGVEPSHYCATLCQSKGHIIENVHLDKIEAIRIRNRYGPAQVVICRHVLEHVPDPLAFLLAIKLLLHDNGIIFIEVPNARRITHNLQGHELWDEHIYSFTPKNLEILLHRADFKVDKVIVKSHLNTKSILLWGTFGTSEENHTSSILDFSYDVQYCRRFLNRWKQLCKKILTELPGWPKPIVCIGASHPQTNFLLFTGVGRHTSCLFDDDPAKNGQYVLIPQPVPVLSTNKLYSSNSLGTIIRGAFGYEDWMDQLLKPLIMEGIKTIFPYEPKYFT